MTLSARGVLQNGISVGGPKGEKSRKEREDQSSNSFALTHMRVHTHTHTHTHTEWTLEVRNQAIY